MRGARTLAVLVALAAPATPLAAQEPAAEPRVGWHVVKPGDTLEALTEHYLGDRSRWPEVHKLNPDVKNPHLLMPGQRVRVLLPEVRSAELRRLERQVEEKPHPNPWVAAKQGDRLKERDGVRTFRASSAELRFDDGSRLLLTEDSLIFLREFGAVRAGASKDALEVVEGQADFEKRASRDRSSDIEIVVGTAKARPRTGGDASAETRARLPKSGEAQLMVYRGETAVEAAGTSVAVARGMGTSVPKDGPPRPPEKLLPPPELSFPASGARLSYSNPTFRFAPVTGAAGYVVEVCRDAACAALVARAAAQPGTEWEVESLPEGELFWRATAVASSGLDGYPSVASAFAVSGGGADREPPAVVAFVDGPGSADGTRVTLRPGGALLLDARDDSGVAQILYRWGTGGWTPYSGKALLPPSGAEALEVMAIDGAGRSSRALRFEVSLSK